MKFVAKVASYTLQFTLSVIAVSVGIFILVQSVLYLLPRDAAESATDKMRLAVGLTLFISPDLTEEGRNANTDHLVVSQWVMRCIGNPETSKIPEQVQRELTGFPGFIDATGKRDEAIDIHPIYIRLANLSHVLLERRITLDSKLSSAYTVAKVGVFLSILIGLLTTIFVGLSSTDIGKQQNRAGLSIRVATLIFPALGTAVAAVIAFYDPSGNLARQSQAAAGLQQLHSQVSIATWKMTCLKGPNDQVPQNIGTQIDSWTQRAQEMVASIGDSRAQAAGAHTKPTQQSRP